jgi:hypothetical protein
MNVLSGLNQDFEDILVELARAGAEFIVVGAFGAPLASAGLTVDDLHHAGTVYQIGVEPRRIDILTKISGVTFDEAWPLAIEASLGEHQLRVLGRAALITNKRALGRLKDLADVERLEQVVPGSSDKAE